MYVQLPLVSPHLRVYSPLELVDILWRVSLLSVSLSRAAAAAAAAAQPAAAAGGDRVEAFREELLLQLTRKRQLLERQLTPQQQQQHQQQHQQQQQQLLLYRLLYGAAKLKLKTKDAPEVFALAVDRGKLGFRV